LGMVHILGVGSIGTFLAYHLKHSIPQCPVTLLLRNAAAQNQWLQEARQSIVVQPSCVHQASLPGITPQAPGNPVSPIKTLIITTKAHQTLDAFQCVAHRLQPSSVIVLLQNGMGVQQELESFLKQTLPYINGYPSLHCYPSFVVGTVTHGCYRTAPFQVKHAGKGIIWLGSNQATHPSVQSVFQMFESVLPLQCQIETWPQIQHRLLLKVAVNACINPLTALHSCTNGELLCDNQPSLRLLIKQLCKETSLILTEHLRGIPTLSRPSSPLQLDKSNDHFSTNQLAEFSPNALEAQVTHVCQITASNISSMRQDVIAHRPTEINYINGYIVQLANQLNLPCETHQSMVQQIHSL
ncbi:ketopantoate reductase PanE/ApbA C terminal-domain-containing protein, partial [Dimargaris cristalligena]